MIKIENIEKEKETWRNDKFKCTRFCQENDIDIYDDDNLTDGISDVLWSMAEEDENYKNMTIDEVSDYINDVKEIIWEGVINAR